MRIRRKFGCGGWRLSGEANWMRGLAGERWCRHSLLGLGILGFWGWGLGGIFLGLVGLVLVLALPHWKSAGTASLVASIGRRFWELRNGAGRIGGDGKIRKLAKKCATLPWGWRGAALSLREKGSWVVSIGAERKSRSRLSGLGCGESFQTRIAGWKLHSLAVNHWPQTSTKARQTRNARREQSPLPCRCRKKEVLWNARNGKR